MTDAPQVPHDIAAERAVLGSILLDPDAYSELDGLAASDFYTFQHSQIFDAVRAVAERNQPPDYLLVLSELDSMGATEQAGGAAYVGGLPADIPSSFHVAHYAALVRRSSVLRQIYRVGGEIATLALTDDAEPQSTLDAAEQAIFAVNRSADSRPYVSARDAVGDYDEEFRERYQARQDGQAAYQGLPTGYPTLDKLLGGYQRSDLLIVAARTGVGKTAFMLNAARVALGRTIRFRLDCLALSYRHPRLSNGCSP